MKRSGELCTPPQGGTAEDDGKQPAQGRVRLRTDSRGGQRKQKQTSEVCGVLGDEMLNNAAVEASSAR